MQQADDTPRAANPLTLGHDEIVAFALGVDVAYAAQKKACARVLDTQVIEMKRCRDDGGVRPCNTSKPVSPSVPHRR